VSHPSTNDGPPGPRFLTVAEAAALLKVSEVSIYRGISAGEFPAVKIRGRYAIPSRAIDNLEAAALEALGRRDLVQFRGEW
jgi:excisionase family DNA binding protein